MRSLRRRAGVCRPTVSDLKIVKRVDVASPVLMVETSTSTNDARLRHGTTKGETPDYFVMTLKEAFITN